MSAGEPGMGRGPLVPPPLGPIPIKPAGESLNLSLKMLGILGSPILFVVLCMSITMFNILCEMAEVEGWDQIWSYWMAKTLEHPGSNILLPFTICSVIFIMVITWRSK